MVHCRRRGRDDSATPVVWATPSHIPSILHNSRAARPSASASRPFQLEQVSLTDRVVFLSGLPVLALAAMTTTTGLAGAGLKSAMCHLDAFNQVKRNETMDKFNFIGCNSISRARGRATPVPLRRYEPERGPSTNGGQSHSCT